MKRRKELNISDEELDALKAACKTYSDQLLIYGLLYSGMRIDELCHLKASWIDLQNETIKIPEQDGNWHPKTVRGHTASRVIPVLNNQLLQLLQPVVDRGAALNMNPHQAWRRLNQLWKKCGYTDSISPHILRHACLTRMANANYAITDIAAQAGHKNTNTTLNTYIHPNAINLIRAVKEKGGI